MIDFRILYEKGALPELNTKPTNIKKYQIRILDDQILPQNQIYFNQRR